MRLLRLKQGTTREGRRSVGSMGSDPRRIHQPFTTKSILDLDITHRMHPAHLSI